MVKTPIKPQTQSAQRLLIAAGVFLGLGQAGFFDGIVFHQLLQWHHMFSGVASDVTVAGLKLNTVGDGLFHLLDWVLTLIGLGLFWQAAKQQRYLSTQAFLGAFCLGAGLFNVVEGAVDHHLLQIHHVKPGPNELAFDLAFLAIGAVVAGLGWLLLRSPSYRMN